MRLVLNLRIRTQILLIVLLPLIGMFGFGGYVVAEQRAAARATAAISEVTAIAPDISNLVHELQKERGQSGAYLGSDGDRGDRVNHSGDEPDRVERGGGRRGLLEAGARSLGRRREDGARRPRRGTALA